MLSELKSKTISKLRRNTPAHQRNAFARPCNAFAMASGNALQSRVYVAAQRNAIH
jgi:hypothetical protein